MLKPSILALAAALSLCGAAAAQPPAGQTPTTSTPSAIPGMPPVIVSDPSPEGTRVAVEGVFANYYPAKGPGPHAAVVVLGGSEGGLGTGAVREAKALQAEGYAVLQVCYFGCPGTPPKLVEVPLETFARGLAWLRAQPGVDPHRVAIIGGSKGSEAALLAAARDPDLKAVIATMPSSVVWPGISYTPSMQPGWTEGGKPLPYLPYAIKGPIKSVFDLYNSAVLTLATLPQHAEVEIPVERIKAPILLVCGEADTLWPSCPMSDQIVARRKAHHRVDTSVLRYKDAGHGVFGVPVDKSGPGYATLGGLGGTAEGNAAARADGWPKALSFLKAHLEP